MARPNLGAGPYSDVPGAMVGVIDVDMRTGQIINAHKSRNPPRGRTRPLLQSSCRTVTRGSIECPSNQQSNIAKPRFWKSLTQVSQGSAKDSGFSWKYERCEDSHSGPVPRVSSTAQGEPPDLASELYRQPCLSNGRPHCTYRSGTGHPNSAL